VLTEAGLRQDARFHRTFGSPWELGLRLTPLTAISLAAWAYFVLVGLGLVSFVLNRKNLSGWRLLAWLGFGVLGAWQARLVPFFAVVAGPITALNLQEAVAQLVPVGRRRSQLDTAGSLACLTAGLTLTALAWFGLLQGFGQGQEGRRAAWAVQPDPSLRHVAETLAAWRLEGKLGEDDLAFQVHPDVAAYCAWYCPEERGFLDHRLQLFAGTAAREYEAVCRDLVPSLDVITQGGGAGSGGAGGAGGERKERPAGGPSKGWQQVFRDRGITLLVLYDPDPRRLLAAQSRLDEAPEHWAKLHVDGQAVVFGWMGARRAGQPAGSDPFAGLHFDAERLAFADGPDEKSLRDLPPAPGKGPGRAPVRRPFWTHLGRPAPQPAWESVAAGVFLRSFEDLQEQQESAMKKQAWATFGAGLVQAGVPTLPGSSPSAALSGVLLRLRFQQPFFGETGRPPALPLLAVRAARRAIAANPDDARAYLFLGKAYLALRDLTVEHSREGRLPPLAMVRHIQVVTALEHALTLNPDLEAAHLDLSRLYYERNYLDAALEHARAHARLVRRAGRPPRVDRAQFERQLEEWDQRVQELEGEVQKRQNQLVVRGRGHGNPLAEAQAAQSLGLALRARDILLQSKVELFNIAGAKLQLELLLMTGQAERARTMMADEAVQKSRLKLGIFEMPPPAGREAGYRPAAYEWLQACGAAGTGDYDDADAALAAAVEQLRDLHAVDLQHLARGIPLAVTAEVGAFAHSPAVVVQLFTQMSRERVQLGLEQADFLLADQIDLTVVAGMLALESGRPQSAMRHFEYALKRAASCKTVCGGRSMALAYLRQLRHYHHQPGQRQR
jgi:hypothetical protein